MRRATALAAAIAALAGCNIPPVQSGINPVNGCNLDTDCIGGYHCQAGACQSLPRTCRIDGQCDPGQSCQLPAGGGVGNCLPANRGFCEACDTTADCATGGLCVSFTGGQYCSTSCANCGAVGGSCLATTDANGNDAGATCLPQSLNCSGQADGGVPATFTFINQNLFQGEGCTVCHLKGAPASFGSLDLVTDPYQQLLGPNGTGQPATNVLGSAAVLRVDPGNYMNSMLYIKLTLPACGACTGTLYGEPMPQATPGSTPQSLLNAVQSWIQAGAPNN